MIVSSMRDLLKLKEQGALNWENILGCFNSNTNVIALEKLQVIDETYHSDSSADFKFSGSPDPELVQKVLFFSRTQLINFNNL
jgi:hypothetical protein